MIRRAQTVYVSVDAFFSLRGKVLHHFDEFMRELDEAQIPCVWMTGWTRAQIDEPRRRLGQNAPYIGENGSGVFQIVTSLVLASMRPMLAPPKLS